MGVMINLKVEYKNVNKDRNRVSKMEDILGDKVYNISKHLLTKEEKDVLSKGLKFGIKPKKADRFEILSRFEVCAQKLDKFDIKANESDINDINTKTNFLQNFQSKAFEFIELSKDLEDNLNQAEHDALNRLANNKNIIITKVDKGNAI
jgi:hypothetical protein